MPGDTYDKYAAKRRTDGRLCLDDHLADQICRMLAEDEPHEEILKLVPDASQERIAALLSDPLAQRRVIWLRKKIAREDYEPESPEEVLSYVKKRLVSIDKNSDTANKDRIAALRELGRVAIDERQNQPAEKSYVSNDALKRLTGEQ